MPHLPRGAALGTPDRVLAPMPGEARQRREDRRQSQLQVVKSLLQVALTKLEEAR
jgi:hypothetical protein